MMINRSTIVEIIKDKVIQLEINVTKISQIIVLQKKKKN